MRLSRVINVPDAGVVVQECQSDAIAFNPVSAPIIGGASQARTNRDTWIRNVLHPIPEELGIVALRGSK